MMVNQLEQLLDCIAEFNRTAADFYKTAAINIRSRDMIIAAAKRLGIKHTAASAMLARIRCSVEMPTTESPAPAEPQERSQASQAAAAGDAVAIVTRGGGVVIPGDEEWPPIPEVLRR